MPNDNELRAGRVTRLVRDRGFGFIRSDENKTEYFFHRSAAEDFDALTEGVLVEFVVVPSAKGPRAERVVVLRG